MVDLSHEPYYFSTRWNTNGSNIPLFHYSHYERSELNSGKKIMVARLWIQAEPRMQDGWRAKERSGDRSTRGSRRKSAVEICP